MEIATTLLWIIFGVAFGVFVLASIILSYHWRAYAGDNITVKRMSRLYYAVSLVLFILAAVTIISL